MLLNGDEKILGREKGEFIVSVHFPQLPAIPFARQNGSDGILGEVKYKKDLMKKYIMFGEGIN